MVFFWNNFKNKTPTIFSSIYALIWLFHIIWAKDGLSACDSLAARAMGSAHGTARGDQAMSWTVVLYGARKAMKLAYLPT